MRPFPGLAGVNAAIVAIYFAVVWGYDGLRALSSPYYGLEERVHAVAASYFRALFDLGLDGLLRVSTVLAAVKFVIAAGFIAYLIEFARALAVRREPDPQTLDGVLLLAATAIMFWAWPALGSGDAVLIRLYATQFLLLTGAMIVLAIERHAQDASAQPTPITEQQPA
ncbi:MAG: hypothetical protein ACJ8F3_19330 [Xanthobacteraceae bacterium]